MKIIQISDLHFGVHRKELLEPFIKNVKTIQPDVIIISGDLTQRGLKEQYKLFNKFLSQLSGQLLIVPGNHDIPAYNLLERFINPFSNYKKYISRELHVQWENSSIKILGVNSVNPYSFKNGRLSKKALELINHYFATPSDQFNLLFFHHNFHYIAGLHHPLINEQEFLHYLKHSTVDMVCTGHLHFANVHLIEKVNHHTCAFLHAGSLLCPRTKDGINSYYVINVQNRPQCFIERRDFNEHDFITTKTYDYQLK